MKWQSVETWIYGLMAAFIGGAAGAIDSALALIIVDPKDFDLGPNLIKTIKIALVLGLLVGGKMAFAYLKQSPLPKEELNQTEPPKTP